MIKLPVSVALSWGSKSWGAAKILSLRLKSRAPRSRREASGKLETSRLAQSSHQRRIAHRPHRPAILFHRNARSIVLAFNLFRALDDSGDCARSQCKSKSCPHLLLIMGACASSYLQLSASVKNQELLLSASCSRTLAFGSICRSEGVSSGPGPEVEVEGLQLLDVVYRYHFADDLKGALKSIWPCERLKPELVVERGELESRFVPNARSELHKAIVSA